jgi:hypothetical protein
MSIVAAGGMKLRNNRGIMNQVEQEIFKACIASGQLPGRKQDTKEPACADKPKNAQSSGSPVNAGSDTEVRGGGPLPGSNPKQKEENARIQP